MKDLFKLAFALCKLPLAQYECPAVTSTMCGAGCIEVSTEYQLAGPISCVVVAG
jgi:hypothetical protein